MKELKDRLSEAMKKRDITASELARRAGIDKGSVSRYLKGEFFPKQGAIASMAEALHISPAWLLGYDVPMENGLAHFLEDEEVDLVEANSELNADNQARLLAYAKKLKELQDMEEDK